MSASEIRDICKRYGKLTALDHVSLQIGKGEMLGLIGPDGAGKTTAMRMLCGLSRPTGGDGFVAGYDINTQAEQIKRRIGYMSQKFSLYEDLTVMENLRLFATIYGMSDSRIRLRSHQPPRRPHLPQTLLTATVKPSSLR